MLSTEEQEAAERRARQKLYHAVQHGRHAPGHINFIPGELLCVLAVAREGSRYHKVLPEPGPGGAGSAPLNAGEFACAMATSPEFAAMVAAAEGQ